MKLPETMKALKAYAPYDYRLEDVPVPHARAGELIIKVEACGICAGDTKNLHGNKRVWGDAEHAPYIQAPCIAGHEFVGRVVQIGEGMEQYALGDRLVAEQIVPCGECRFCKEGNYHMCSVHDIYGYRDFVDGGMAEYMRLHTRSILHRVPESLSVEKAALIEPFACGMHAVQRGNIHKGDVVVISGAGAIGLSMLSTAREYEPACLIALDLSEDRLALARQFGAEYTLNPTRENVVERVKAISGGLGCDVYIDASGHPSSIIQGTEMLRSMGMFVCFGVSPSETSIDFSIFGDVKELTMHGSHLGKNCYEKVITMLSNGSMKCDNVVTHSFPLTQWEEAFAIADAGGKAIKVILKP